MTPNHRVVVTGVGALSALGDTRETWSRLLAGRSGVRRLPQFVGAGLPVTTGGEVLVGSHDPIERDSLIANRAIDEALDQAGLQREVCGLMWGTGLDTYQPTVTTVERNSFRFAIQERNEFRSTASQSEYRFSGRCFSRLAASFAAPRRMIATACASSTQAIGEAFHLIRAGRAEAIVAGGSSVMLTPFYFIGFAALQAIAVDLPGDDPAAVCRPFDRMRRGFALADGAAALVLDPRESALRRGALPLVEVIGFGSSQDAFDLSRPPPDGQGAELAMRRALHDARLNPEDIDAINAHGTATISGDAAEAAAIRRLLGEAWKSTPVSSIKGAIGHAMAAAGALEAIAAIETCRSGLVPPTINLHEPDPACELDHVIGPPREGKFPNVLTVSFGMGGQNAAVAFTKS